MRYNDSPAIQTEYTVTSAPEYEILTAAELRYHLRLPDFGDADADEDAYLTSLIKACGNAIETTVRRPVRAQTRQLTMRRFPYDNDGYGGDLSYWWGGWNRRGAILLDVTPIRAVTAVTYVDGDGGESMTVPAADYDVRGTGEHITRQVEIVLRDGKSWPLLNYEDSEVTITVDCGWTQAALPEEFKHAARLIAGNWYNFRNEIITGAAIAKVPRSVEYLLQQFERYF